MIEDITNLLWWILALELVATIATVCAKHTRATNVVLGVLFVVCASVLLANWDVTPTMVTLALIMVYAHCVIYAVSMVGALVADQAAVFVFTLALVGIDVWGIVTLHHML